MRLSKRMCYGTRTLLELSSNYNQGTLSLAIISQSQDLPGKYLEQLMQTLKSGGLVQAIRGPKGGYALTRQPQMIPLSEVYNCLEGSATTVDCVQYADICARTEFCPVRPVWTKVHETIMGVLASVTLQDLLNEAKQAKL